MSQAAAVAAASKFVPRHSFPQYNLKVSDFKGHQYRAFNRFKELLPQLNMVMELRDLRAPLSTRNVLFDRLLTTEAARKVKRLIVYTKKDMVVVPNNQALYKRYLKRLKEWHEQVGEQFIVVDCKYPKDLKVLYQKLSYERNLAQQENNGVLPMGYRILVSGMPNVGKSSLINTLRQVSGVKREQMLLKRKHGKVAKTGGDPGVTRSTSEIIRISRSSSLDPPIYLIDTPGIGLPGRFTNDSTRAIVLSLCGCIKPSLIDPEIQADYMLYLLNLQTEVKRRPKSERYTGENLFPTNDIRVLLTRHLKARKIPLTDNHIKMESISWLNNWRQHRERGSGVLFDPEMLLQADEFSYKEYVENELALLDDFLLAANDSENNQNAMMKNINELF